MRYHGIEASCAEGVGAVCSRLSMESVARPCESELDIACFSLLLRKANSGSSAEALLFCDPRDRFVLNAHCGGFRGEARDVMRLVFGIIGDGRAFAFKHELQINLEETALETDMSKRNGCVVV